MACSSRISDCFEVYISSVILFLIHRLRLWLDGWRGTNASEKINYLSVAAGNCTYVNIELNTDLFDTYGEVRAELPTAAADGVSFTDIGTTNRLILSSATNCIPIYAKGLQL